MAKGKNGATPEKVDPAKKALEERALRFLQSGARRDGPKLSEVGAATALFDAARRRYNHHRELASIQNQFNAFAIGLKDRDGARQLKESAMKYLALIEEIDREFPGDGDLPSARDYMERVVAPQIEREIREMMFADMAKEAGIEVPDEELEKMTGPRALPVDLAVGAE